MALNIYIDGIDKDNIVCNKNIEIGEYAFGYFLVDIYIIRKVHNIQIYVTNTCIYVHISKYILAQN